MYGPFTIHDQDIQILAIEIFETHNGFSQVSFWRFFHSYNENNFYNLRSQPNFQIRRINSTFKGVKPI